jgi:membrane protein DedA with SNARE-associated domain
VKKREVINMSFSEDADEILAFVMGIAGVIVLMTGTYAMFILEMTVHVDVLILISGALLGPSTGYLFGKSIPKK